MRGKLLRLLQPACFYNIRTSNVLLKPPIYRLLDRKPFSTNITEVNANSETELSEIREPLFPKKQLVSQILKNTDPTIDYGTIYQTFPNNHPSLIAKYPEPRIVWEEQDCTESFPASPEEANLDIRHYIEQRDMWERRRILNIPKFCVGSIIAVTRADEFASEGFTRFVGLCVHVNRYKNTKGHLFALRNVILGEALEIQFPFYNPLIQKIEVLRHQRWGNEMAKVGLRFLRDYPLEYSTIDENMIAEEYTDEPSVRQWTEEDKQKIIKHFEDIYESRRRTGDKKFG